MGVLVVTLYWNHQETPLDTPEIVNIVPVIRESKNALIVALVRPALILVTDDP